MAPARISLLVGTNSLLLLTGNWPLQLWKGAGISALFPAGESDIGENPCIFPVYQGYGLRDEFAPDCFHRHSVCHSGDLRGRCAIHPLTPRGFAGFLGNATAKPNRRPSGLEDAAAPVFLCCQAWRFGFAPAKGRCDSAHHVTATSPRSMGGHVLFTDRRERRVRTGPRSLLCIEPPAALIRHRPDAVSHTIKGLFGAGQLRHSRRCGVERRGACPAGD